MSCRIWTEVACMYNRNKNRLTGLQSWPTWAIRGDLPAGSKCRSTQHSSSQEWKLG